MADADIKQTRLDSDGSEKLQVEQYESVSFADIRNSSVYLSEEEKAAIVSF